MVEHQDVNVRAKLALVLARKGENASLFFPLLDFHVLFYILFFFLLGLSYQIKLYFLASNYI